MMTKLKLLPLVFFFFINSMVKAQNKAHDWGVGLNSSLFSYSAALEHKLSNPYEYTFGTSISFSRYLNNHFDLSIEGLRSTLDYPLGVGATQGEPFKYEKTTVYGANFSLKYKLDNGFIIREHFMFAPYLKFGGGAVKAGVSEHIDYIAPIGAGVAVNLSNRVSLTFESQLNYGVFNNNLNAFQHNAGLKIHIGDANRKRILATRKREREIKYAKIKKYREKQRIAQARQAKEKLNRLQTESLVAKRTVPSIDEDQNLLATNEPIALSPQQPPKKTVTIPVEVHSPQEDKSVAKSIPEEPIIPVSPGMMAHHTPDPVPVDSKPPLPKPKSDRSKIEIPTVLADYMETAPAPAPPPAIPAAEKPIKETAKVCENSEVKLTEIGKNINFDSDMDRVRSRMHKDLQAVVDILKTCEDYSYVIIAHSDTDGNSEYNRQLSARRALAIKQHLVAQGIDSKRLIPAAYGAFAPIVPNTTAANKAKNRRIEFKLNRTSFE